MFVYGLTHEELELAARRAGVILRPARAAGGVSLRLDSTIPQRIRPWVLKSEGGGRTLGVCWHGYYAFFAAVYQINERAGVKTALATWRTRAEFEDRVDDTPRWNARGICNCDTPEFQAMRRGAWADTEVPV